MLHRSQRSFIPLQVGSQTRTTLKPRNALEIVAKSYTVKSFRVMSVIIIISCLIGRRRTMMGKVASLRPRRCYLGNSAERLFQQLCNCTVQSEALCSPKHLRGSKAMKNIVITYIGGLSMKMKMILAALAILGIGLATSGPRTTYPGQPQPFAYGPQISWPIGPSVATPMPDLPPRWPDPPSNDAMERIINGN